MDNPVNRGWQLLSPIVIIMALGAFLLLFRLDHRPFWQDEAETACLARNVLKYGVPRAYDGVNLISQEQGQEFDQNFLWRWSPWLQIYVTAAAFRIAGLTTAAGRFPFAALGIGCIFLVYTLVRRNFNDRTWACLAALLLACSVSFLLFSRQCRYYSLGSFLVLLNLYAFRENWQSQWGPALLLGLSFGLLFYTNYLLFLSYTGSIFLAAVWVYADELRWRRIAQLTIATGILILPGLWLFSIQQQATMLRVSIIYHNLERYAADFFQFLFPLPVALYFLWRYHRILWTRAAIPRDPGERFVLFLSCIIFGNILILSPVPQCEIRYLIHLYPLCAIILGWVMGRVWRYHRFSGALLGVLLIGTNWLCVVPMDWLGFINRPIHNDPHMLAYPNLPLKLYLTELSSPYPDVNQNLIRFFQSHAQPGEIIVTTYDDLPLQFYTSCNVLGGLQGPVDLSRSPDWLVLRRHTRWNRHYDLNESEIFVRRQLLHSTDYRPIVLAGADEIFGNQPDPYFHRFIPPMEAAPLVIYEKLSPGKPTP